MSITLSNNVLVLGSKAPDFCLPGASGKVLTLDDFARSPALLVIFMCNHCPFVKHIEPQLVELILEYQLQGMAAVAINSNDVRKYPEDSPGCMREEAKKYGFTFPYLYDETQETAKAYGAACTPDFFLFNSRRELVYHGQMDDSRPGNGIPVTGRDLREALDDLLSGRPVTRFQKCNIGCNIKWRPGHEPDYFFSSEAS